MILLTVLKHFNVILFTDTFKKVYPLSCLEKCKTIAPGSLKAALLLQIQLIFSDVIIVTKSLFNPSRYPTPVVLIPTLQYVSSFQKKCFYLHGEILSPRIKSNFFRLNVINSDSSYLSAVNF